MRPLLALFEISGVSDVRALVIPIAGAAIAGLSYRLFRGGLAGLRLFGAGEPASIMNFSSLGTLRCLCGPEQRGGSFPNRRRFCRCCGFELVKQDRAMLEKQLTTEEIKQVTRSLHRAAVRARRLELPPSITTIKELHRYLDADFEVPSRKMPPPPSFEQTQVQ